MDQIKKIGKFLHSMKCALILLIVLALVCVVGSVIPQNEVTSYYTTNYSQSIAGAIMLFGLNDVFHCWWFVVLTLFLCVNLLLCNVLHFPALLRQMKEGFSGEKAVAAWNGKGWLRLRTEPEKLFEKGGFRKVQQLQTKSGEKALYASRHRMGIWGAWLCHLGILVLIAGFGLGQMLQEKYTVYGVPGQTKPVGDTGYELTIDSFEVRMREDETVEQYVSHLTVCDARDPEHESYMGGEAMVNEPLSLYGMKFYQNSTGWAATLEIWQGEEKRQEEILCAGEYAEVEGVNGLEVAFSAFYPDYGTDQNGMPMTYSSALINPGYFYTIYYQGKVLGMNVLTGEEKITIEDYTIWFKDPQQYTLIQVKKDSFTWLAALGGILIMIALLLAFYVRPEELWAVQQTDGSWLVGGRSRKGGTIYEDNIVEKGTALGGSDVRGGQ